MKRTLTEIGQIVRANQPRLTPAPLDFTPEGVRVREGIWEPHEAITRAREILRQYGGRDD